MTATERLPAGLFLLAGAFVLIIAWFLFRGFRTPKTGAANFVPGVLLLQATGGVKQYAGSFLLLGMLVQFPTFLHGVMVQTHTIWSLDGRVVRVEFPDEAISAAVIYIFASVYLMQAALAYGCLHALRGERPRFGAIVLRGIRDVVRLGVTALLAFAVCALPVGLGIALHQAVDQPIWVFVGMFVALWFHGAFCLTVPVAYDEDLGVFSAMRRSIELSAGCRYRMALMFTGALLTGSILSLMAANFIFGSYERTILGAAPNAHIITMGVLAAIGTSIYATAVWIAYESIRRQRGGTETPLERVFS